MGGGGTAHDPLGDRGATAQPQCLLRPRLLRLLDAEPARRVHLVVGPPGAGKTTLIAQWSSRFRGDVVRVRVGPADAGGGLLHRIAHASGVPAGGAADLGTALTSRPEPVLLVLDDLHAVAGSPVERDLERFLLTAPDQVRVVIGSRTQPSFNLARSELPMPVIVGGEDLAFRSWEVEELFRLVYRAPLGTDDAAALTQRTQGWAAAMQLFHLSTRRLGPTDRRLAVAGLAVRSQYARDYLEQEVLRPMSLALRRFLVRTCLLTTLTAQRCEALLGASTSGSTHRLLSQLERQVPLVSSPDGGLSLRCHEVLRRHLQSQLQEEVGARELQDAWCRAAAVCEDAGDLGEALQARAAAHDWDGVRRLLRRGGAGLLAQGAPVWSDVLPGWLQTGDPWAGVVTASRLLDDGRCTAAATAAERALAALDDPLGRDLARAVMSAALAWAPAGRPADAPPAALRAVLARRPTDAPQAAEPDAPAALVRGLGLTVAGALDDARQELQRCTERDGDRRTVVAARVALAALDVLRRPGLQELMALDDAQGDADRHGLTWLARVAHGLGSALAGEDRAGAVLQDCQHRGDPWGAAVIASGSALAGLRDGTLDPPALDDVTARWRALGAGSVEAWARAARALLDATDQAPEAVAGAQAAESFARTAAVPGALCVAYLALACCLPRQRSDLLDLAEVTARATGVALPGGWTHDPSRDPTGPTDPTDAAGGPTGDPTGVVAPGPAADRTTGVPLDVRCFGQFRLEVGGRSVDLSGTRPRTRSLLRLLALHAGRLVHREQLVEALWPDLGRAAGMHNLQVHLSSLRAVLDPGSHRGASTVIRRDGDAYRLALPEGSTCDVLHFDDRLAAASRAGADVATAREALRQALEAYTGDLLTEDGPADWVVAARDEYRVRAAAAAARLAALELAADDPAAAAAAASRSVAIDRYQDGAWRTLIEAYGRCGDLAAGRRAQRGYADVLLGLGVSPDDAGGPGPVLLPNPRAAAGVRPATGAVSRAPGTRPRPVPSAAPAGRGTPT